MSIPKILVLTSSYPRWEGDFNGNYIHNFFKELSKNYEVYVIAPYCIKSKKHEIINNINIYRFKQFPFTTIELAYGDDIMVKLKKNFLLFFVVPFFIINQLILAYKIIKKEKIDIIHAFWLIPQGIIAVLLKQFCFHKTTIVCSLLGADINGFNGIIGNKIKKNTLHKIDVLISQSLPMSIKAKKLGYGKEVYYIPLSIDTNLYSPDKKALKLKNEYYIKGKMLLFVATITERKGIYYLIESIPKILIKYPETKLIVIGDGNLKVEMEQFANKLNVKDNVFFLGSQPPELLPGFFATCDIFILPSLSEGFPLVVLSALSCEAITCVSDLPVFIDLLHKKQNLLQIFEKQNSNAISDKIIEIMNNFELYKQFSTENRQYIIENFDLKIIANKYKKLVSEHLGN